MRSVPGFGSGRCLGELRVCRPGLSPLLLDAMDECLCCCARGVGGPACDEAVMGTTAGKHAAIPCDGERAHHEKLPPFTCTPCPTMWDARSEARNAMTLAISPGSA